MFWVIIGNLRSPRGVSEASFEEVPSGIKIQYKNE